jgi:hypothetical protein
MKAQTKAELLERQRQLLDTQRELAKALQDALHALDVWMRHAGATNPEHEPRKGWEWVFSDADAALKRAGLGRCSDAS